MAPPLISGRDHDARIVSRGQFPRNSGFAGLAAAGAPARTIEPFVAGGERGRECRRDREAARVRVRIPRSCAVARAALDRGAARGSRPAFRARTTARPYFGNARIAGDVVVRHGGAKTERLYMLYAVIERQGLLSPANLGFWAEPSKGSLFG
jgi:hypothetical protein